MGLGKNHRAIGEVSPGILGSISMSDRRVPSLSEWGVDSGGLANLWLYRGALRIPGVLRATMLRANLVSQTEWDAWTTHGVDQPVKADPRPPLLERPFPGDTRVTTLRSAMLDYIHDGNAVFIVSARNSFGIPISGLPVPASQVGVRRITPANVGTTFLPLGSVEYNVGGQTFDSSDVIHVKGLCAPGALRGAGVLELALSGTFATAREQEAQAQRMSRHGVPSGILKVSSDSAEGNDPVKMAEFAQAWVQARDINGVAAMNSAVDFQPLAWNPNDMQMIEARQFTLLEIALIMGVPPKFVGASGGDPLNYSTSETEGKDLLRFTVSSDFEAFEQAFSAALQRGTTVRFDRTAFEQPGLLERFQAYAISVGNVPWAKPSEIRQEEGQAPMPGIDAKPTPPTPPAPQAPQAPVHALAARLPFATQAVLPGGK
jgi:HK97 family phage portal protein